LLKFRPFWPTTFIVYSTSQSLDDAKTKILAILKSLPDI